jgi:hypothetical protein
MKSIKILLIFVFSQIGHLISAQEFSFQLKFEDAIGNVDTLILGYDINATDSVDLEFGEINIIANEFDSIFDVRVTDELDARSWWFDSIGNYHLKKQIIKKNCDWWPTVISIDIKCNHWPVTSSWDSSLFNEFCKNGSVFTSINPGGWWDVVGDPSDLDRVFLQRQNHVTFSDNWEGSFEDSDYNYINENQDSISVFWVAICDISKLWLKKDELKSNENLNLFPNPFKSQLNLEGLPNENLFIEIYDIFGKLTYSRKIRSISTHTVNTTGINSGLYILRIRNSDTGKVVANRIIVKR